jgi:eukaryotic-like serine/threonine-protein kinase
VASAIGTGELLKGRYRLERTLGRGGMAAVWLGHDEVLERPVAVKVLSDTIASDPGFVARFRREAQTAAGLSHPNLVGVYDFSDEGERPYLVMQLVPGEDLAARLERGEGVDCERLARELLEAVAHIHDAGIIHRDIKPGNIVIEPDGTAKLIDFGIAQPRDATALTRTGLILGTERYAAPEVMEGKAASERSDLYSCGVVLRACEGRCSRALHDLIGWLTSPEPSRRPASARQALAQLERGDREPEQPTQVFSPPPRPARQKTSHGGRWVAAAALAACAVAIGAVALLASSGGDERSSAPRDRQAQAKQQKQQAAPEPAESAPAESAEETTAAVPAPEGTDPEQGSALNEQGFELIQAGEYEAAVPVLEEAVAAFPEGSEDVNYAYALFNLGNALRLSGRPEEAIPVLERRLEIPNQTATVEAELEAARAEAG